MILANSTLNADFLLHAGPIGDVIPIPLPLVRNVASIGDLFLTAGLGFFLFATVLRSPEQAQAEDAPRPEGGYSSGLAGTAARQPGGQGDRPGPARPPRDGLASGLAEASTLDDTIMLGSRGTGMSAPGSSAAVALAPVWTVEEAGAGGDVTFQEPLVVVGERLRRHPYVRLALNPSFSALWAGRVISLFGDRVHQIALAFLVLAVTDSPVAVAFVFVAATLPNLFLSPIAGTYVDRWDQKEVMVVSDLLRAAIVLIIPIAAVSNLLLVYPLVFLVTSISIFFRPARVAVLPRIVRRGRAADRELGDVDRRDDRRRHRLPAGGASSSASSAPRCRSRSGSTPRPTLASAALIATIVVPSSCATPRRCPRQPTRPTGSSPTSRPAGASCAARRCCSRTPSRRPSGSSRSARSRR